MANMFNESQKHITPTSLEDSVKTDRVIKNLWSWASGLETLGMILFVAIIVIGVITAVISSFEVVNSYSYKSEYEFNWGMFFLKLIDCALYAFIEYCAYHVIALLVGSLASITQNTKATAKIIEYNTLYKDKVNSNQWKCSKCGRLNENYVGTCACGNTKSQNNNTQNN